MIPLNLIPKTIYGRVLYYPACDRSTALTVLLKVKSLNKPQLAQVQALGFTINLQPDPALLA